MGFRALGTWYRVHGMAAHEVEVANELKGAPDISRNARILDGRTILNTTLRTHNKGISKFSFRIEAAQQGIRI